MNSIPSAITDPTKRYDYLLIFDVTDGNPNGDPDAGNLPRVDPETLQGIVTDVCLKRKIRNYVDLTGTMDEGGNDRGIFVRDSGIALNTKIRGAHLGLHPEHADLSKLESKTKDRLKKTEQKDTRAKMCELYYDIRMFGGVLSTGDYNAGQVRGPMQLTFARSLDPIIPSEVAITRVAITKEGEQKETEIGRKSSVPYGLYVAKGFYSPMLADPTKGGTGVSTEDLQIFWEAVMGMFENDRSASRGHMQLQQVCIFSHENPLGNAPSGALFRRVRIPKLYDPEKRAWMRHPRSFEDYGGQVFVDKNDMPAGVSVTNLLP